ncbi:hypothetical protein BDY19DRAFT_76093 [Irpex rosettiformis]|uniref:Uncharacterized protein n=1 Tax=Irpex rosettiformis TaxID=378272 RepID=A0ACB8ULP5_9APHY|nr:hypothetical protein BDY19DRAFT_76093 [Irpex rosettiformis]
MTGVLLCPFNQIQLHIRLHMQSSGTSSADRILVDPTPANPQGPMSPGLPATDGQPYSGSTFSSSFDDRVGVHQFQHDCKEWGYVAQLHEWAAKEHKPLEWIVIRAGGEAHQPVFEAYPLCK